MHQKLLLFIILCLNGAISYERGTTIPVAPGKVDCFYHEVNVGETIGVDYQVIDGGDLDITFKLQDPNGRIIVTDIQQSANKHKHEATIAGDYRMCFSNKFGTFTTKIVFFNLFVEREGVQNLGDDQWNTERKGLKPEEHYSMKVNEILSYIDHIRALVTKAQHIQDMLSSSEQRDRNLAENNFTKVNVWSVFQTIVMILVGLLQVYMVRSIFETDSRMNRVLRKMNF